MLCTIHAQLWLDEFDHCLMSASQAVQEALQLHGRLTVVEAEAVLANFGAFSVPTAAVGPRLAALQSCTAASTSQLAAMLRSSPTLLEMDAELITYISRSLRGEQLYELAVSDS